MEWLLNDDGLGHNKWLKEGFVEPGRSGAKPSSAKKTKQLMMIMKDCVDWLCVPEMYMMGTYSDVAIGRLVEGSNGKGVQS